MCAEYERQLGGGSEREHRSINDMAITSPPQKKAAEPMLTSPAARPLSIYSTPSCRPKTAAFSTPAFWAAGHWRSTGGTHTEHRRTEGTSALPQPPPKGKKERLRSSFNEGTDTSLPAAPLACDALSPPAWRASGPRTLSQTPVQLKAKAMMREALTPSLQAVRNGRPIEAVACVRVERGGWCAGRSGDSRRA